LFRVFGDRLPHFSDFVAYWHEKARAMLEQGRVEKVGLLATQGIRGGANRRVLERIKESGEIYMAWSDEPWILEGANVHVSFIAYDDGSEPEKILDGKHVEAINANLTAGLDLTTARRLPANQGIAFEGDKKGGPWEITQSLAAEMLDSPNPDGRSNRDVVRPWLNGQDLYGTSRGMWIIDFGATMSEAEAALYEAPYEYARKTVLPVHIGNPKREGTWWRHERPRPEMRSAIAEHPRIAATVRHSKHRIWSWISSVTMPDSALVVIARDDDYTFGVLHSRVHEAWARGMGTQLREVESGFRYTPTTTFETFPFPDPNDEQRERIADAARELHRLREGWLAPEGASAQEIAHRTLTNLYNERPTWLDQAHARLDEAVLDAYGWRRDLLGHDLLGCLLRLNLERSSAAPAATVGRRA
jgi:hypothetical protein